MFKDSKDGQTNFCPHDTKNNGICDACLGLNPIKKAVKEGGEMFDEKIKDKITSHEFNGSCCYNNNENGKGHKECRYPYNPGRGYATGTQCLKLEEEHLNFKHFLSTQYAPLIIEAVCEVLKGMKHVYDITDFPKSKYLKMAKKDLEQIKIHNNALTDAIAIIRSSLKQ